MRACSRSFFSLCSILLAALTSDRAVVAQLIPGATKGQVNASQLMVACSPDKPIAHPGDAIRLRAFVTSPEGWPLDYTWSAPSGQLEGQGSEVKWDFSDVSAGVYEAKVTVKAVSREVADCSVRVIVQVRSQLPTRGDRETGRSFLLPNEVETLGYGLYSYLLFGSRPTTAGRERYLKAIEEYLKFPDIGRLETFNTSRRTLNITYLPVLAVPGRQILDRLVDEHYDEVAEWILKQYDYERARTLLRGLPGSQREGPYIVSFLKPPTWSGSPTRPYLYQDQSSVPPHLVSLWAKEFLNQAAQEQFWQERTAVQLVLKLRTTIGILASALPQTRKSLDHWITWVS
jgi:hypothetical protein